MHVYFTVLRAYNFLALRDFGIPPQRQDQAGVFSGFFFRNCKSCVYNCDDLLSCNWFIFVKVWWVFIQQTHFLGWPDIRMFRIQRRFVWLIIDETYGWVHLGEEKKSGVKVPCRRKQGDGRGLNPGPPDPEFAARPHTPPRPSHEDILCSIVKSFLTKTLLDGSRSKFSKTLGMTQSCRGYFFYLLFFQW